MIKAVIFDLDGVIWSTDQYHYQAWKQTADYLGVYFDEVVNERLRGVSRMDSLEIILEKSDKSYSLEEKEKIAEYKNRKYIELLHNMSPDDLEAEVSHTLSELRSRGYKLAIGSSSKNAKRILKQIGLENYFDAVSDGTNIKKSKPNPEVFLNAAQMLNEKPGDCLVVEDAYAGIEAAVKGGFISAGIGTAAAYEKSTYSLRHFSDLLSILN